MIFILLFAIVFFVRSLYVTQSEIESCTQYASDMDPECENVMSIGLTIYHGDTFGLEATTLTSLNRADEPFVLEEAVTISVEKSEVFVYYPVVYKHTVAYALSETVVKVQNLLTCGCKDEETDENPTCGWVKEGGEAIADSQGFCCCKPYDELLTLASQTYRGEGPNDLNEKSSLVNYFSTGHCLRNNGVWFKGYEVETSRRSFDITVTLTIGDFEHEITVNPSNMIYNSISDSTYTKDSHIRVELIGDYALYESPPDLSNKIFYTPSSSESQSDILDEYWKYYFLIDRESVSLDGLDENKIGVSYKGFRDSQAGTCDFSSVGDGIHNQLENLYAKDVLREAQGLETEYLIRGMSKFEGTVTFSQAAAETIIKYQIKEIQNSMINIVMDMKDVSFVTTESEGVISSARVDDFEAQSRNGKIFVTVLNYGDIKSTYRVSVDECTAAIQQSIPEQAISLDRDQEDTLTFHIYTQQDMDAQNECTVTLKSGTGVIMDSVVVQFDTTEHTSQYAEDIIATNTNSELETASGILSCDCGLFDYACKVLNFTQCWLDFVIIGIAALVLLAVTVGVVVFFLAGGGQFLPQFLCFFCKSMGCCLKCTACFTRAMAKTGLKATRGALKAGKKSRGNKRHHRHHRRHHHHRRHKHKTHHKKSHKKKSKPQKVQQMNENTKSIQYPGLSEAQVKQYVESGDPCYLNVNNNSALGKEMLNVLKKAMPLPVGAEFCLVGTIRFKHDNYQFIIHEDLLHQTWQCLEDGWLQCESQEEAKRIPDQYRGFKLTFDHITQAVSQTPFVSHKCINQPLSC